MVLHGFPEKVTKISGICKEISVAHRYRFTVILFHSNLYEKITINEQKVTSNEQKVATNEQKVTSNEQKVTGNEQKVTGNEEKVQPQETTTYI